MHTTAQYKLYGNDGERQVLYSALSVSPMEFEWSGRLPLTHRWKWGTHVSRCHVESKLGQPL